MQIKSYWFSMMKLGFFFSLLLGSVTAFPQEATVLKVGTSSDYPPFSFMDNGKHAGFDIELIEEIAKRLHYSVEIIDMPFKTLLPAMQLGRIDLIAAGLSETPERAKQVLFLPPHLEGSPFVILTKGQSVTHGISDLKGKEVVVNDGYTAAQYMQAFPEVHLQYLKSTPDALAALESNRVFAFVTSKNALSHFFKQHPKVQDFHSFVIEDTGESASLAVAKGNAKLFQAINRVVLEMKKDGSLQKLQKKWGLM
jgi:ABC-type amino acid transport substrate-binding protein